MGNNSTSQRQRSQFNPLNLGKFDRTSLRVLTGTLGMRSEIIRGGYGRDTYNHWYQVTLIDRGYILLFKAGTKPATANLAFPNSSVGANPKYAADRFMIAVYNQNTNPIIPLPIHQQPEIYYGQVAAVQSETLNNSDPIYRFDNGNEMYFELEPGNYLICVSAVCNELIDFAVGLVLEFPSTDEQFILLENRELAYMLQEDILSGDDPLRIREIPSPISANTTLDTFSAFTPPPCTINQGVFMQVNNATVSGVPLTWIIKDISASPSDALNDRIFLDATPNWASSEPIIHSRTEWRNAWKRDHQQDNRYPAIVFDRYTNAE